MKNKVNIIFYIVIAIITIIAGIEGMYIFSHKPNDCNNSKEKIVYRGTKFLKENVEVDAPEDIKVNAYNLNDDNTLLLEITSSKSIYKSNSKIEYYDSNNNLVKEENIDVNLIPKDRPYALSLMYPKLEQGTYSGKIKVSIAPEYDDKLEALDEKLLELTTSATRNEATKETTVIMSGKNPYENFNLAAGYILLYKEGNLITANYAMSTIDGDNITIQAIFPPTVKDNELNFVEYDDVRLVINTLY